MPPAGRRTHAPSGAGPEGGPAATSAERPAAAGDVELVGALHEQRRLLGGEPLLHEQPVGEEIGLADRYPRRPVAAADADVELVPFPARKSFYELLSEELSGMNQSAAIDAWVSQRFSPGELDLIRSVRGPFPMFRRGEALALMPFTLVR